MRKRFSNHSYATWMQYNSLYLNRWSSLIDWLVDLLHFTGLILVLLVYTNVCCSWRAPSSTRRRCEQTWRDPGGKWRAIWSCPRIPSWTWRMNGSKWTRDWTSQFFFDYSALKHKVDTARFNNTHSGLKYWRVTLNNKNKFTIAATTCIQTFTHTQLYTWPLWQISASQVESCSCCRRGTSELMHQRF